MLTPEQAQAMLAEVKQTESRSSAYFAYWRYGMLAQIWGAVWAFAYLGMFFLPQHVNLFWLCGDALGALLTIHVIGKQKGEANDGRVWAAFGLVMAFGVLVSGLIGDRPAAVSVFWTWLFMTAYMVGGLWFGRRWTILGAIVCALSVLAYLYLMQWFNLAMALISGGGLILGGTWMRRVH
jgi:hypothetical protein